MTQTRKGWGAHCYTFLGRPKTENLDAVATGIVPICYRPTSVLFDPNSIYSYVSTLFSPRFHLLYDHMSVLVHVFAPIGDVLVVNQVYRSCLVYLASYDT